MENFTTLKDAQIVDVSGLVQTATDQNTALQKGDSLAAGKVLTLAQDSEITLAFEDGTEQRITGAPDETLATNDQISQQASTLTPSQTLNGETPDNVQAEIDAIQASIESGDDIDLPDTTAGGLTGNEGTDFVTLDRQGNELLAGAGYETAELDNTPATTEDPELFARGTQPTLTQSDVNVVAEDTTASGNVLDNDSDADDVLSIQSYTVAGDPNIYLSGQTATIENGSLTVNGDGSYTFIPADDWNGELPVVNYLTNTNATDTLSISVTPVSDLTDDDESRSTPEDITLNGSVLANAVSADGIPVVTDFTVNGTTYDVGTTVTVTEGNLPVGSLTVRGDGSYTFAPAENYNDEVPPITYTVSDGINSDVSTLTIEVTPVSDLTDDDESRSTPEDITLNGSVLTNAASADGTPVVTDFNVNGTTYAADGVTVASLTNAAGELTGELTVSSDGSYAFVPEPDYNGEVPQVSYTVSDGINSDVSTLTIEVTPVSDLTDDDESRSTPEDITLNGSVLTNAASADGTPVVTDFTVNGTTYAADGVTVASLTNAAGELTGELTVSSDGSYAFVPEPDYNGEVPQVSYTVSDGTNTDVSTLTIDVTPVSDLTDDDESRSTPEDITLNGSVLANAVSADGIPVVTDFTVNGTTYDVGTTVTVTEGNLPVGSLTVRGDGSYTFAPAENYNDEVPPITYTVSDGINSDVSTLTIDVTPVSDLTDGNESVNTPEDNSITGSVLTNAASADGTPVVSDFTVDGTTYLAGETAKLDEGDFTLSETGIYTFVPADNYNDVVPVVTYTVTDGVNTDTSTLAIDITPVSDLSDGNESVITPEDTSITGSVLTNAASADGTPAVSDFTVDGTTYLAGETAKLDEGDFTLSETGIYTFVPADNYNDVVPVVTYTVTDGVNTDTSTLTINVTPVNDPPVAADDSFSVDEGQSVSGNVITHNDGDGIVDTDGGDGATLNVTQVNGIDLVFDGVTGEARADIKDGFILIQADGSFTYTHNGNDPVGAAPNFAYTLSDGTDVAIGNVTLAVTPASNIPPVAADDSFSVDEGQSVSGNVITHNDGDGVVDTDGGDGATLNVTQVNGVDLVFDGVTGEARADIKDGFILIQADGSFTYTHNGNDPVGAAPNFAYTLSDGTDVAIGNVTINVNDLPEAVADTFSMNEATTVSGNVMTNDTDQGDGPATVTHVGVIDLTFDATDDDYATLTIIDGVVTAVTSTVGVVFDGAKDNGILRINADGDFTYENKGFLKGEPAPTFEYTLSDTDGDSSKANVTIEVATIGPVAYPDGTGFVFSADNPRVVSGNVAGLGRSSSGDVRDDFGLDSYGNPAVTQVEYTYLDENSVEQTVTKLLDASNTSANPVSIVTDFGTLSIDNKGNYTFSQGADLPIEPLVFNYTIQDGDTVNPETAEATLTINITPPEAEGLKAPGPSAKAVDLDLDETSGTINTDFDAKALINVDEAGFVYSPDTYDLSDILTDGHTGGLETYLAAMGEDESAMVDIDLAVALKDFQVDDSVVLEKGDANSEHAAFTTVTNGFLADGAIIISDTAEASSAPIAELDSQEFLS